MAARSSGSGKESAPGNLPRASAAEDLELAGVIHDVNQMLAVVMGRAGLLLHRGRNKELEVDLHAIELAARDAAAMLARIGGAAPDSSAPEADCAPLRKTVADAGLLITPGGGASWGMPGWRLGNEVPADLAADVPAQVVREVLNNLILNSLEAAPAGVEIQVTGGLRGDRAVLVFTDNGPGVPEVRRANLFQPGGSSSGEPGRGIGLAGCRNLLQRWGGDLTLLEHADTGAGFELDLPRAESVSPAEQAAVPHAGPTGRSVLIVDDEPAVRDMLGEVMTELGCVVTQARDADEALAVFSPGTFDVVFLDQSLPGRQGDELAAIIRGRDPVVAIALATGWGREKILAELDPEHVDLKAVKPLDMSKMMDLLSRGSALADERRTAALKDDLGDVESGRK